MTLKFYAGIGSRRTPDHVLDVMTQLAGRLRAGGWICRTGGAPGADAAFARGAAHTAHVFLPWPDFTAHDVHPDAMVFQRPADWTFEVAESVHPAWERCSRGAKALHARNVHQILGLAEDPPSRFVVCWTPGAETVGGTATAIRLARLNGIEVVNLADRSAWCRTTAYLNREPALA
jgi:hypothetical protein